MLYLPSSEMHETLAAAGVGVGVGCGVVTGGITPAMATLCATIPPVGQPETIVLPFASVACPVIATTVPDFNDRFATLTGKAPALSGVAEISPQPFAASKKIEFPPPVPPYGAV